MEEKIFDTAFFQQLNQLHFFLNLRLHGGMQGGRKSHAKGSSLEFSDFREYMPGDDFRRIDWNAYGRFDKFFIKVFMEERQAVFNFFIDRSQSMDQPPESKRPLALKIVGALSYVVLNHLDRVVLYPIGAGSSDMPQTIASKQAFQRMLKQLEDLKFEGTTDLTASILKQKLQMSGVSIVVSDFFTVGGLERLEEGLKYLAYKKQQIILIQILSEGEREPNELGEVTFVDSETGEKIRLSLTPKVLEAYQKRFKAYQKELEQLALKYGAKWVVVDSKDSIEEVLFKQFTKKQLMY